MRATKDDRLTVFFTPLNPFGRDSDEEEPRDDNTIPQKAHHSHWKRHQDAVCRVKLSRAQEQGLQFWHTKTHAIILDSPLPADCIYRVISQDGDRIVRKTLDSTTSAKSHTQKQLEIAAAAVDMRGRDEHKETCARQDGDEWCQRQHNRWSNLHKETSSRRSISRGYLTKWSKDEWHQRKVEKVKSWIMHKIYS